MSDLNKRWITLKARQARLDWWRRWVMIPTWVLCSIIIVVALFIELTSSPP